MPTKKVVIKEGEEDLRTQKPDTLSMFCAMAMGVLMMHNPGLNCSETALNRAKQMEKAYRDELERMGTKT